MLVKVRDHHVLVSIEAFCFSLPSCLEFAFTSLMDEYNLMALTDNSLIYFGEAFIAKSFNSCYTCSFDGHKCTSNYPTILVFDLVELYHNLLKYKHSSFNIQHNSSFFNLTAEDITAGRWDE